MRRLILRFISDTRATTSIEYAMIAMGIGVAVVGAVSVIGTNIGAKYNQVKAAF